MSASIRQSNLFAAEDYKKIFKAYQFIDYTAYDFDTLKQALLNYIQTYYPEDFNDYIESSEFIAIVELLAYLGTSLAFRTELNSRENFIDTAERRESVIRLAQMVNYVPRRNIPASGLFKIAAVQTDQVLVDANGNNINDLSVFWDDPNNPEWFDQFVQICNAAFSPINPFGRPTKSGNIGSIPTDLYQLNSVRQLNVAYSVNIPINGQQYPVDICNPDFIANETIFERHPDPADAFNFIYRNDSLGVTSNNTGFFLFFKQGNLFNVDTNFEFPVPNRTFPIDIQNINQDDVYVQETDQDGNVITKWLKVPALSGENIIYNSIRFSERNIFSTNSGANDTIGVRFTDGNFGNVPTGLFRFWIRTSANQPLVIRPADAQGLQINIPYIGTDQQNYVLRVVFSLEQTVGNAAASETDEQIKLRAPEVFSTQSRMVNGSDYNVLPLIFGNQIAKIKATNRTYSGQSRYIDLNDPTGFHRDLIIFGQDGALFRDNQNVLTQIVSDSTRSGNIESVLVNTIQEMLRDKQVSAFFYDEYLAQFEEKIRVNPSPSQPRGRSLLDLVPTSTDPSLSLFWQTSPTKFKNDTGYMATSLGGSAVSLVNNLTSANIVGGTYQPWGFISTGSVIDLGDISRPATINSVTVNSVVQTGLPLIVNTSVSYANIGPIELGKEEPTNYQLVKVYPTFRNDLTTEEIAEITEAINGGISFWLYYDLLTNEWHTSTTVTPGLADQTDQPWQYANPDTVAGQQQVYSIQNWPNNPAGGLIYVSIASNNQLGTTTYDLTARGRVYIFESYRDVRFYWEPNQIVIDNATGLALQDTIEIMPFVNTNSTIDNNAPVIGDPRQAYLKEEINFNITGTFIQDDGYQDTAKVEVSLVDTDNDGIADDPSGFNRIVGSTDRIVFEYFSNEVSGYQSTRPWIAKWARELEDITSQYYVYFPKLFSDSSELYGPPFISATPVSDPLNPPNNVVFMDLADLVFINNRSQMDSTVFQSITSQVTAFFNGTDNPGGGSLPIGDPNRFVTYPWLRGSETIDDKNTIVTQNFINKSYLISAISPPGFGAYYTAEYQSSGDALLHPQGFVVTDIVDRYHFDKNGKVFTQNTTITEKARVPMYFKWQHYSPLDQRIDPSATNIVDMIAITDGYYRDVQIWKSLNSPLDVFPAEPTTEQLRIQFQDLNKYKMVSDNMIWNSGTFKILFGTQADTKLQATFKVVKSPATNISDNEVKTRVVQAIDVYFDIRNWDFGEKFFYTELAAFIHQQLSRIISSVVIVPNNANSQFGNLFEITAGPNQLFISTATVNNVQIVANLTEQNLRV